MVEEEGVEAEEERQLLAVVAVEVAQLQDKDLMQIFWELQKQSPSERAELQELGNLEGLEMAQQEEMEGTLLLVLG